MLLVSRERGEYLKSLKIDVEFMSLLEEDYSPLLDALNEPYTVVTRPRPVKHDLDLLAETGTVFVISWGKQINRGVPCVVKIKDTPDGWMLLAGSQVRANPEIEKLQSYGSKIREILTGENIIRHEGEVYCTIKEDMPIQSPALAFTLGTGHIGNCKSPKNGWKTEEDGLSFREAEADGLVGGGVKKK